MVRRDFLVEGAAAALLGGERPGDLGVSVFRAVGGSGTPKDTWHERGQIA